MSDLLKTVDMEATDPSDRTGGIDSDEVSEELTQTDELAWDGTVEWDGLRIDRTYTVRDSISPELLIEEVVSDGGEEVYTRQVTFSVTSDLRSMTATNDRISAFVKRDHTRDLVEQIQAAYRYCELVRDRESFGDLEPDAR